MYEKKIDNPAIQLELIVEAENPFKNAEKKSVQRNALHPLLYTLLKISSYKL